VNNIKTNHKEYDQDMDWIQLTQDMVQQ